MGDAWSELTLLAQGQGQGQEGLIAIIVLVSGTVGGAVVWLASFLMSLRDKKQAERKAEEKTITDHLENVNLRLEKESDARGRENSELRDKVTVLTGHVLYLEGVMEAKGIKFRPLRLPDDSGNHRPIDPGSVEGGGGSVRDNRAG